MTVQSPFLHNVWYMAAWGHEVGEALLRRQLLGEPVLLYRKEDGAITALVDRCPHRFAPLSLGTREGDAVRCPYHGLVFDAGGRCVHNPFSDQIPAAARLQAFPVIERDGIVWFWPGDPTLADDSAVPDFGAIRTEGNAPVTGLMPLAANYEYGTDNLMDLSHIEFVHSGSFAGRGVIFAGEHNLIAEGDRLRSNWRMPNVAAPPHTFGHYDPAMVTDHWLEMRWDAPAAMLLEIGACPAGGKRESGVIVWQAHILTPETENTTHYFWATSRTGPPSEQGDAMLFGMMSQAFGDEDKPVIEAAYANLSGRGFWDLKPLSLGVDSGGTRARRVIEKMKRLEATQVAT